MKVLSYLELIELYLMNADIPNEDWKEQSKYFGERVGDDNLNLYIHQFYSQPFEIEMITELFNHWEILEYGEYSDGTNVITSKMDYGEWKIFYDDFIPSPFPRTLDEFITDCQRYGIELEWSEK